MSKRTERHEAERLARKLAFQQHRRQPPLAASSLDQRPADSAAADNDLLARAQAFFETSKPSAPVSTAQLEANRSNAKLSTGPVTQAGKAIASRNNTRHGLTAEPASENLAENFKVLPIEDQASYNRNLAAFRAEWQPATATEHDLISRMVMHQWLRSRALRLQETLFDLETGAVADIRKFDLYRRYEAAHERGFNKALADIQRLRSFQLRQQNGFESQKRKNEEHEAKMRRRQAGPTRRETVNYPKPAEILTAAVPQNAPDRI